jgi:uncharacterized repeat protein (TIGR01451 family)
MRTQRSWRALHATAIAAAALLTAFILASASQAAVTAPGWEVTAIANPTHLPPGGQGYLVLRIHNVGKAPSSGPVTVTDTLPPGMVATEAGSGAEPKWDCSLGAVVTCTNNEEEFPSFEPLQEVNLVIAVNVPATEGRLVNRVTVSGGGALTPANVASALEVDATPATFGLEHIDGWFSNPDGTLDTQAGSHPYSLTIAFSLNNTGYEPATEARTVTVDLPRGLIGNPTAVPRCTAAQLNASLCPPDSQVGMDAVALGGVQAAASKEGERPRIDELTSPVFEPVFAVYNMVPPPGVPAQLAFTVVGINTRINTHVRTGGDYGLAEVVDNVPQNVIAANSITIWGVPADPSHDYERHTRSGEESQSGSGASAGGAKLPFLTLPTACEGAQDFTVGTEAWASEGIVEPPSELGFLSHDSTGVEMGVTGCDHLSFNPKMSVALDTSNAETPAGLTVELKVPQEGLNAVEGLATADIKDTTVTLPEGVAINPGQAHGLQACSAAQSAVGSEGEPTCPNASKVGTDEIETPLLFHGLKGDVYVLDSNPPNLKLLVAASGEGVNLKLVGDVSLDEQTGRLTTTFKETPELPFTTFRLSFSGGAQAALYTPPKCGAYKTTSDFTPWSTPSVADAFPSSEFVIAAGAGGGACPSGALPFSPSLAAGSTTDQAGGFTSFSLLLTREDGQQRIGSLQFKTPEGLLGMISKVPLCPEAQANVGTCPAASQIGHTTVEAGPGPYPLVIPEPGQAPAPIYLTEGYKGAPYGLSIVVPLHVGPFTLQTQVVRAKIQVDPVTTQLTIATDPLPTIIDGIPTDLRAINAVIDRPGFMFNPTNCEPQSFSGTATSTEGAGAPIESHFQMGSCRSLSFKPNFKVSTSAHTSRLNGASLDAKIIYPTTPLGNNQASSQANVASVKVELPKILPSRLTTLQKACLAKVFEEDPARCPHESLVGSAAAVTPVLPVQLNGPVYFVSHGGEAFPSLVIVLQGYGVTVDLVGTTFISKSGITSSTFKQVPDVPITSFELKLPEGPYSALTANGNLCQQKLVMPTDFVGQNGATLNQSTPIEVEGCFNGLIVKSKKLAGRTLTLDVVVPAAGHLTAGGKGLSGASKTSHAREQVKLTLHTSRQRKFTSRIRLAFTPNTGKDRKKQVKSVTARA